MRNLQEHPITHGEILECLNKLIEDVSFEKTQLFGDMRPLLLERTKQMVLDDLTRLDREKLKPTKASDWQVEFWDDWGVGQQTFPVDQVDKMSQFVVFLLKADGDHPRVMIDGKYVELSPDGTFGWRFKTTENKSEDGKLTTVKTYKKYKTSYSRIATDVQVFESVEADLLNVYVVNSLKEGYKVLIDDREVRESPLGGWYTHAKEEPQAATPEADEPGWDVTSHPKINKTYPYDVLARKKRFGVAEITAMNAFVVKQLQKNNSVYINAREVKLTNTGHPNSIDRWAYVDSTEKKQSKSESNLWTVRREDSKTTRTFTSNQTSEMDKHIMFCLNYTRVFVNDMEVVKQEPNWRYL